MTITRTTRAMTLMLCCISALALQAAPVSLSRAQQAAADFMSRELNKPASTLTLATQAQRKAPGVRPSQEPAYYVFNSSSSYVVIAGDDRMPTVLGYSDNGTFDTGNMPEGLKALLDAYAAQAASLGDTTLDTPQYSGSVARSPITPMLTCRWNQSSPYNLLCPAYNSSGKISATGCVATAMAQVMYYHKWPAMPTYNIPAYTSPSINKVMPEMQASDFPLWANMKDTYSSSETGVEAQAVATLMRFCGQSVGMDYGAESGAVTAYVASALIDYFDYAPTAQYVDRENYTTEGWSQMLYDELAAGRPVVYAGFAYNGGGHAFVCDGADANGLFHINWGWGGNGDGYFLITRLNPNDRGVGSTVSNDGYIMGNGAVIGIQPNKPGLETSSDLRLSYSNLSLTQNVYTRNNKTVSFTGVSVKGSFFNMTTETKTFGLGYGAFDENGQFIRTLHTASYNLPPNYGSTSARSLSFSSNLAPGTYYVKAICRVGNVGDWKVCNGGESNYLKAVITETTLTLSPMGNAGPASYTVNNVAYNGALEKGRSVQTVATLTNTCSRDFSYIYLNVNGTTTSVAACDLNPGETGEILMHFTPSAAGNHTVKLTLDEAGTQVIYSGQVNIKTPAAASIGFGSIGIVNLNTSTNQVMDDKLAYSFTVTNNGTSTYNDVIEVDIYRHTTGNYGSLYKTQFHSVNLPAGGSTTLTGVFDDLDINESYFMRFAYFSNGTLTSGGTTPFLTIMGATVDDGFDPCDVNKDGEIDVADVNCVLARMMNVAGADPYNRADVDKNGIVDINDVNTVINYIFSE